jgi:hypothetical protein
VLQPHHFCIGPEKYSKKRAGEFCFCQSRHVALEDLSNEIRKLISKRDLILVVHDGRGDFVFSKAAKIHLRPLYIVDTPKAAQHPLDLDYQCTIERMLSLLGCPFNPEMLHNASNDANFTLLAFILIDAIDATNDLNLNLSAKPSYRYSKRLPQNPYRERNFLKQ